MREWIQWLICPECHGELDQEEQRLHCRQCGRAYTDTGVIRFLDAAAVETDMASADARIMVRGYRQPNRLLKGLRRVVSSEFFPGKAWRQAKQRALQKNHCLVIGSGVTAYADAIHLDLDDFPHVDLVADAHRLPFRDDSVPAAVCETVLEHVAEPDRIIGEAHRVLKPGGHFFFIVPFVFPFHGQPNDFQRWSREGLRQAFAAFDEVEVGIHGGPCSALVNLLSEWAFVVTGLRFPRGYVAIKGLATALLFPLKFLDLIANRLPEAHRMAATLYVSGRK